MKSSVYTSTSQFTQVANSHVPLSRVIDKRVRLMQLCLHNTYLNFTHLPLITIFVYVTLPERYSDVGMQEFNTLMADQSTLGYTLMHACMHLPN